VSPISRVLKFRISSPVFSGIVWSCIWLGIGALFLSMMLAGNSLRETELTPWVFGIHGFAALAGGFVAARNSGRKGWYYGALNGVLYTLLVVLCSFLALDTDWSIRIAALLGLTFLTGAIGGMLGVGTGGSSRVGRK